jgi:YHS domain-containing protein
MLEIGPGSQCGVLCDKSEARKLFMKRLLGSMMAGVMFLLGAAAFAGAYFEKGGAAIEGYDPVAYFTQNKPVKGSTTYSATHQGSTFHFASAANRDAFAAAPEKYAPQYGGFCAYAVASGYKAKIEPDAFTIVDGKLYLNYDQSIQRRWRRDIPGYIRKGDRNWPEVSKKPFP